MEYSYETEAESEGEQEEAQHPLLKNLDIGNIVEQLPDAAKAYEDISRNHEVALRSMDKWKEQYKEALMLSKLMPDVDEKTFPFKKASLAMMPYVLEAMLDFASRASPELVWGEKIIDAKIYGKDAPEQMPMMPGQMMPPGAQEQMQAQQQQMQEAIKKAKEARKDRIVEYMQYQITEEMPNWRMEQDKGIMALPCVGTFYKKTYYDYEERSQRSDLIMADKLIFNFACSNFYDAEHKFEALKLTRNELLTYIRGYHQWDIDESDLDEEQESFDFIEASTWIDLDEDGMKEPYCAILFPEQNKIVSLYPRYDEDTLILDDKGKVIKITDTQIYTQYTFLPDPEGGPMGLGWGILLGPMFRSINSNVRQMQDAGTLHNASANSALIAMGAGTGRGNRQESEPIEIKLGRLTPVDMGGTMGNLRDNIIQFPFAGPSQALFSLTEYMINSARELTNAAVNIEATQGEAASLYLARLQQGLKRPNWITTRVYDAAKLEFRKIALLNYKHHDSEKYNRVLDQDREYLMEADFNPKDCDIRLVANPAHGSDIERAARAQAVYQIAMGEAGTGMQISNLRQATTDLYKALGAQNVDELVPPPPQGPSKQEQLMFAQMQAEAEMKNREIAARERDIALKEQKAALEAAKEMTKLGMEADIQESEITKRYAETLKLLVEAGIARQENALQVAQGIENMFIGNKKGDGASVESRPIPTINPGAG